MGHERVIPKPTPSTPRGEEMFTAQEERLLQSFRAGTLTSAAGQV